MSFLAPLPRKTVSGRRTLRRNRRIWPSSRSISLVVRGKERSGTAARRLVIDLWRYLDAGVIPEGAVLKPREIGAQRRLNVEPGSELIE